ncbi:MAG: hypothetical protein WA790_02795 [Sulfitobacter sp.]
MADLTTPLSTDSANTIAEAVKNADFTPLQLIVLILGGILLWNLRGLYNIHVTKYQTRRKYDLLDKKADDKIKLKNEKKKARINKATSSKRVDKP